MIILNKNTTSNVIVRDGVKPIVTYYLFVIYDKVGDVVKYFQSSNVSSYPEYLSFNIDEDIQEVKCNSTIHLEGNNTDYEFKLYYLLGQATDDSILDNLFNTLTEEQLVSKGILRVIGSEQSTIDDIYL